MSFEVQMFLILMNSYYQFFSFMHCTFGVIPKNIQSHKDFLLCFLLQALWFHTYIWVYEHFRLSFEYDDRYGSNSLFFVCESIQVFQHHLLKTLFLPHWITVASWLKISWPWNDLFLDSQFYSIDLEFPYASVIVHQCLDNHSLVASLNL